MNYEFSDLTLPLPRGGGVEPTPLKGIPSITFEQNNLEASHFALCNFNNILL